MQILFWPSEVRYFAYVLPLLSDSCKSCIYNNWIMTSQRKGHVTWENYMTLHWRHNDHDGVSNHQPHDCLLNRLFRRRSKKTSKLRVTGPCVGNSPGPVNSPHKRPVTWKMFTFEDVIMDSMYVDSMWLIYSECSLGWYHMSVTASRIIGNSVYHSIARSKTVMQFIAGNIRRFCGMVRFGTDPFYTIPSVLFHSC